MLIKKETGNWEITEVVCGGNGVAFKVESGDVFVYTYLSDYEDEYYFETPKMSERIILLCTTKNYLEWLCCEFLKNYDKDKSEPKIKGDYEQCKIKEYICGNKDLDWWTYRYRKNAQAYDKRRANGSVL